MTMSEEREPDVLDVMVVGSGTYPIDCQGVEFRHSDRSDRISEYALYIRSQQLQ